MNLKKAVQPQINTDIHRLSMSYHFHPNHLLGEVKILNNTLFYLC